MAHIIFWHPTTLYLDLRPIQKERNHVCYWKPNQVPRVSEIMDLGGELNNYHFNFLFIGVLPECIAVLCA